MMYVLTDKVGVVVYFTPTCEPYKDGFLVDYGDLIISPNVANRSYEIDNIPSNVKPRKSTYDGTNWGENPNYIPPGVANEELELLKSRVSELEAVNAAQLGLEETV